MDCPTCEAMVDAYVDGELSAAENAELERALELCPGCRARQPGHSASACSNAAFSVADSSPST